MRASSQGSREEKCHAKVCKQIRRPRRKVKKEVEVGGELNRRKPSAEKVRVLSQQCSEGEKEPANTMSEREMAHRQFVTFLDNNNKLSQFQSGNRKYHSTETALLSVTDCAP